VAFCGRWRANGAKGVVIAMRRWTAVAGGQLGAAQGCGKIVHLQGMLGRTGA
jgi:hypothetical protein